MRAYCTIFDKNYLYQGVALYNSLKRCTNDFILYALCMDSTSHLMMKKLGSPSLIPISIDELVTAEISGVRNRTTHGQFCWVCQPLIIEFILERHGHDIVTYLEADSWFFSDPEILFHELGGDAVSLVPHNYSPEFDNTEQAGRFCVQFNAFRKNAEGRAVLDDWKSNCFKYHKDRPTNYPGQTCLDSWPERFQGVKVIKHPGAGVAPWNIQHLNLEVIDSVPCVNGVPIVFYHYHQYARYENGRHELGYYPLSKMAMDSIYKPYVRELAAVEKSVRAIDATFSYRRTYPNNKSLFEIIRSPGLQHLRQYTAVLKRKIRGTYNTVPDQQFFNSP